MSFGVVGLWFAFVVVLWVELLGFGGFAFILFRGGALCLVVRSCCLCVCITCIAIVVGSM